MIDALNLIARVALFCAVVLLAAVQSAALPRAWIVLQDIPVPFNVRDGKAAYTEVTVRLRNAGGGAATEVAENLTVDVVPVTEFRGLPRQECDGAPGGERVLPPGAATATRYGLKEDRMASVVAGTHMILVRGCVHYRSFGVRVTSICAVLEPLMPDQGTVDSAARWVVTSCPRTGEQS